MKATDKLNGLQPPLDQEGLLFRITTRIRQSLELQEILTATVAEVRSFLGTDRVKIYRFDADGCGEVIAESIHEQRLPCLLGLHFPADDIPEEAREMFLLARQRSIVDVASGRIGLSPLQSRKTGESLKVENISYRRIDPCHIQYLTAMGVQSSLAVPILEQNATGSTAPRLWGLLVSHHSEPRTILKRELRVVQQVADQVSIAIAQSNLLTFTRAEQQREATINRVSALLHTLPTIQLQAALEASIEAFNGVGGRLYIEQSGELYTWGEQPILPNNSESSIIEQHPAWQNFVKARLFASLETGNVWAIADLYKELELEAVASAFKSIRIRGLLVMPLNYRHNYVGTLSIFRKEFDRETLWAGRLDQNKRQELPRLSFEAWQELKKEQAPEWKPEEISLAQTLTSHFSMAIQQQEMYQQVQTMNQQMQALNLDLERRVQEKTSDLEKSLLLTEVLRQITQQIRSTLDYRTTLQSIVREVRSLLNTDRVVIYQFLDETNGEVIVEEVNGAWGSVLGMKAPSECFPDEYARLYLRGRVRATNDTASASLSPCHQEFLLFLQVQANLVVPINMGQNLWGLLIAHQCESPRNWQDDEIDLLQQLADQAAIAIQQSQLYEVSRAACEEATAKAAQLAKTLQELKETQTQLIQTEKMSSLGQLVAGIAHEINNPVTFISGNLSHASEYTKDLLELLRLYQWHYADQNQEIASLTEEIDLDFLAEDLPKMISSMRVGAERICSIVLSLRNFSRLDEAQMKPVNLHEGIDNTLLILQHRLKANINLPKIEIIKEYGNLPLVECYTGQLNQVFMNILSNAIDALEESLVQGKTTNTPEIRIRTEIVNAGKVVIRIADNGLGMKEEVIRRVFDPFFTTKPVGKGTGLGLAISYQIVADKHRGVMKCVSEPGKGTEFWVEIPLKQILTH
jgi:light-regulated signal transduction histidine kinase (bacteriophytochrome)